jgi:hypothetical protein
VRQLELFTTAELAAMRDRTRSRRYSPANEQFRREHARHRAWGLARRHAEKLRRARDRGPDAPHPPTHLSPPTRAGQALARPSTLGGQASARPLTPTEQASAHSPMPPEQASAHSPMPPEQASARPSTPPEQGLPAADDPGLNDRGAAADTTRCSAADRTPVTGRSGVAHRGGLPRKPPRRTGGTATRRSAAGVGLRPPVYNCRRSKTSHAKHVTHFPNAPPHCHRPRMRAHRQMRIRTFVDRSRPVTPSGAGGRLALRAWWRLPAAMLVTPAKRRTPTAAPRPPAAVPSSTDVSRTEGSAPRTCPGLVDHPAARCAHGTICAVSGPEVPGLKHPGPGQRRRSRRPAASR